MKNFMQNDQNPWWVILIKVIIYALGLLLAGYGTAEACSMYFLNNI